MQNTRATNSAGQTEGDMASKIIAFLIANGCMAWRQPNQAALDLDIAASRTVRYFENLMLCQSVPEPSLTARWGRDTKTMFGSCFRKVPESRRGVPDILGITPSGRFLGVEIKIGSDTLSKEQKAFRDEIRAHGGIFIEVRNYNDFLTDWYLVNK